MAMLKKINSRELHPLLTHHLVGRMEERVDLYLNSFDVSRIHAYFDYNDKVWTFNDVSANGTLYNEDLLHRTSRKMRTGDRLQFSAEDPQVFEVTDLDTPVSFLITDDKEEVIFLEDNILELSDGTRQRVLFMIENGEWILEEANSTRVLKDGEVLEDYKGKNWTYVFNQVSGLTQVNSRAKTPLHFNFEVSPDYEHVSIQVQVGSDTLKLPPKAMNFPIYLLAKQMQEDLESNQYSDQEKGWVNSNALVEALQKEMVNNGLDVYYLNVQIYRFRKALAKTDFGQWLNELIERRAGQLRFNHQDFTIKEYHV